MTQSPEEELAEFLASKPKWVQTALQEGSSKLTVKEESEWLNNDELRKALTAQYVELVSRIPAEWKRYRKRLREQLDFNSVFPLPKAKPGRKKNVKLAERIWALDAEGKSNRQIQEILNANGENLSLEGVQAYLKKRRRRQAP